MYFVLEKPKLKKLVEKLNSLRIENDIDVVNPANGKIIIKDSGGKRNLFRLRDYERTFRIIGEPIGGVFRGHDDLLSNPSKESEQFLKSILEDL